MAPWQRNLYILTTVQFLSALGFSTTFGFLPLYINTLDIQSGLSVELLSGLVYSAQAFTMMVTAPVWGALADRYGRKMMVMRATFGGAAIVALIAFVQTAEQLVLLRALQGALTGVMGAVMALVAADVPRHRTGYALGLLQMGMWGGISIGPLVGGVIADTLSFRAAFLLTAALLATAGMLVLWGAQEHSMPVAPKKPAHAPGMIAAWQHVLGNASVRMTYLARFLHQLGQTMVMPFSPLLILALMGSENRAATVSGVAMAVSAAAGTASAIVLGRYGDRVGHQRILAITTLIAAIGYLPVLGVSHVWQFVIVLALTGTATGGSTPSLSALLARFTEPGEEGAVYGLESAIMAAGRAVAPLAGAALVSVLGLRSTFAGAALVYLAIVFVALRWIPASAARPVAAPEVVTAGSAVARDASS